MTDDDEDDRSDLPSPEEVIAGGTTDEENEIGADLPDPEEVIVIHDEIETEYDLDYTGARVAAPRLKIERLLTDVDEYEGIFERAGALLRSLITSHFFEDGNKRTAWATTVIFLERHNAEPAVRGEAADPVLKAIRRYDVEEIAEWLATGTIDEDRLRP